MSRQARRFAARRPSQKRRRGVASPHAARALIRRESKAFRPPRRRRSRLGRAPQTRRKRDAEAAFLAGAALARLDAIVRENPPWAGVWRRRLALKRRRGQRASRRPHGRRGRVARRVPSQPAGRRSRTRRKVPSRQPGARRPPDPAVAVLVGRRRRGSRGSSRRSAGRGRSRRPRPAPPPPGRRPSPPRALSPWRGAP